MRRRWSWQARRATYGENLGEILKPRDALSRIGQGESSTSRPVMPLPVSRRGRLAATDEFPSTAAAELFQKSDEIVGHVIDVRRVATFELPAFAKHLAGMFGHHQHSGHAEG